MKGRLIVQSKISTPWPQTVCFLPPEDPIPRGWEELEVMTEAAIEAAQGEFCNLCRCRHLRSDHVGYRHNCLKPDCSCRGFWEAE
jgi:hypothetical protein